MDFNALNAAEGSKISTNFDTIWDFSSLGGDSCK